MKSTATDLKGYQTMHTRIETSILNLYDIKRKVRGPIYRCPLCLEFIKSKGRQYCRKRLKCCIVTYIADVDISSLS